MQWNQRQHGSAERQGGRVCREAGGRVTTNMLVRELDLHVPVADARRLEVVVDGLPLFGGAQLAIDTTLVSVLHCDGTARPRTANEDGVVLAIARQRKERTCPELVGPRARARLVVLAGEVAGRWSEETRSFVSQLAKARGRKEPAILRRRAEQAWRMRWMSILGCSAAKAFASSLLNLKAGGADGETPCSHEVMGDFRMSEIDMV